jgi:hypothetical protein
MGVLADLGSSAKTLIHPLLERPTGSQQTPIARLHPAARCAEPCCTRAHPQKRTSCQAGSIYDRPSGGGAWWR